MRKTPLTESHPEVARDFHPTRNGPLKASDLGSYERLQVWWRCPKEHEANVSVYTRVRVGCKECNRERRLSEHTASKHYAKKRGSIRDTAPDLMARWDHEANSAERLFPENFTPSSHIGVSWRCDKGHEYKRSPKRERKATHCPFCYEQDKRKILSKQSSAARFDPENTLEHAFPLVAAEWNYERNSKIPSNYEGLSRCPR